MTTTHHELVSVCIIAYRSGSFITEALDSVYAQTYPDLELIVSDDCSPDDTVEHCRQWLADHGGRFVRTQLITSDHNTGVSANANRAFRAAQGRWIKILAGDDKLLPSCIDDHTYYAHAHPEAEIIFSNLIEFNDESKEQHMADYTRYFERLTPEEFRLWHMVYSALPAPSSFILKSTYERLGGFDESIPFMEDKPFWMKAIDQHTPMACFAKPTVAYRIHGASIVQSKKSQKTNKRMQESNRRAASLFLSYMRKEGILMWLYGNCLYRKETNAGIGGTLLYCMRVLNPYYYYFKKLKQRLS